MMVLTWLFIEHPWWFVFAIGMGITLFNWIFQEYK